MLITLDQDFANIRAYPPHEHEGIIALRLGSQAKPHVMRVIQERVVPQLEHESPQKRLWVVDETSIRIRGDS